MSNQYDAIINLIAEAIKSEIGKTIQTQEKDDRIPVGISNRHIHLSNQDLETLFGTGYNLNKIKDLSQIGQFACKETVIICGPKGAIEKVRVLGPVRNQTQVEILKSDCFKLGIPAKIRLSGDLIGTPGLTVIGPKGSVHLQEGVIVAQRHIHMTPEDAIRFNVKDKEIVDISVDSERGGIYTNVIVRVTTTSGLECHLDTDEANAMDLDSSSMIKIIKHN